MSPGRNSKERDSRASRSTQSPQRNNVIQRGAEEAPRCIFGKQSGANLGQDQANPVTVERMMVMKLHVSIGTVATAAIALALTFAQPAHADSLSAIRTRGMLNVGVKSDVLGFAYLNPKTEQYEGYEVDIARELAKRLLGDPAKVSFTAVTPGTRGALLDSGEVDMLLATFSITPERKIVFDFSPPYYTDGVALLVPKMSGIKGLSDLNNKPIGIAKDTDTASALMAKAGTDTLLT